MTPHQRRVAVVFGVLGWFAFVCMGVSGLLDASDLVFYLFGGAALVAFAMAIVSGHDERLQ